MNVVNEVNIVIVTALLNSILRLHTLDGKAKHSMSNLTIFDLWVEFLLTVLGFNVTDFVVPPHNSLPVRLVIFEEHSVVVRIFSQSDNNILRSCILRLLDTLEGKNFESLSNIENGSLFSSFVL